MNRVGKFVLVCCLVAPSAIVQRSAAWWAII